MKMIKSLSFLYRKEIVIHLNAASNMNIVKEAFLLYIAVHFLFVCNVFQLYDAHLFLSLLFFISLKQNYIGT